jgi:hypothetical protein
MSVFEWVVAGGLGLLAIIVIGILSQIHSRLLNMDWNLNEIRMLHQNENPVTYKIGKDIDELNRRMYDLNDFLNPRIKD